MLQSPSSSESPARKRQRLSSSTYDDKVGNLTQEDLNAFGKIKKPRFEASTMGFVSATKLPVQDDYRSPSPEGTPPEPDIDAWFNPAPLEALPLFTTAKSIDKADAYQPKAFRSPLINLKSMHTSNGVQFPHPSVNDSSGSANTPHTGFASSSSFMSPLRPGVPQTDIASSSSFMSPLRPSVPQTGFASSSSFMSPLRPSVPQTGFASSSSFMSPLRPSVPQTGFASPSSFMTPLRSSVRPNGMSRTRPAPFVTPFKPGMKPGDPGRSKQSQSSPPALKAAATKETPQKGLTKHRPACVLRRKGFFSLAARTDRQTLALSGLLPQQYGADDLESMGIDVAVLNQITPETALYYSFHTTSSVPPPSTLSQPTTVLGSAAALRELLDRGCVLATKPWVDNHWCLILWKLAGMVALDPEKETTFSNKRWCWAEVIRQLLYRYERELNSGCRPPLRQIAAQDAPAAFPMVLCVSNIFWSPAGVTDDGLRIEPYPELEVTDGWYRLRAQVDLAMVKAVRKGVIRVGRKIGVAGARLSSEKKDPSEILEAYNSTKLVLHGNSSQLVAWHTKLGFTRGPCVSTLHSLSTNGGMVAAMDLVIIKTHAIAFIQFVEGQDGQKHREGPWNEEEENRVNERWKKRREVEASKITEQFEKKFSRYEGYIDRLERKAGNQFQPGDEDAPPDSIDALYDELEYPDSAASAFSRMNPIEAGWLARHARKQNDLSRESMGDEIEKELKTICPPREVRSFRILVVQDARTIRRPANRTALLTVWNVLQLNLVEGSSPGSFGCGQRFLVTNLLPIQHSAWMDCEPGSEVYLSTRQDTRWTIIKAIGV